MEVILIRHGQTKGNKEYRFIGGQTEQEVSLEGLESISSRAYPKAEALFVSPMIRCIQTARCIYGEQPFTVIEEFRECNFGLLEGKSHRELDGDPQYQQFLDAGGALPYPEGESITAFTKRVMNGFAKTVKNSRMNQYSSICCIVHGGTIMAILSTIIGHSRNFYDWHVDNGCGYKIEVDEEDWKSGCRSGQIMEKI